MISLLSKNEIQIEKLVEMSGEQLRSVPTVLLSRGRIPHVLAMLNRPESAAAEQYRLLAHTLEKLSAEGPGITIGVSSAVQGEGKTVTSLNLAFALAETRARNILLVDADFRGGRVAEILGLGELLGLTNVLQGQKAVVDVLRRIDKNLTVLPGGTPTAHPVGMIRSAAWRSLVTSLRNHFDCILFDCPPVCVSDEISVLGDVIDKFVLVVRSGLSRQESVKDALAKISGGKMVGFVLNDATASGDLHRTYNRDF